MQIKSQIKSQISPSVSTLGSSVADHTYFANWSFWQNDAIRKAMKYQLILQFSANSMADFDRLVSLETKLMEKLGEMSLVDGHDFGSGRFNIFLLTNEPTATFTQAHKLVLTEGIRNDLRSAYRETNGEKYVVLRPSHLTEFSVL